MLYWILITALVVLVRCDVKMDLVKEVARHYFCGCIYIVHSQSGLQNDNYAIQWNKELRYQVSTLTAEDLVRIYGRFQCRKNQPLIVIPNNNHTTSLKFLDQVHLSSAIWLMFLDSKVDIEDLNIPIDCQFLIASQELNTVVLSEIYRVSPSHALNRRSFGHWNSSTGLVASISGLYSRRDDLEGLIFKTAILENLLSRVVKKIGDKPIIIKMYLADLWTMLQESLNFGTDLYSTPWNNYGALQANGSWNGIMGLVVDQKVHIGLFCLQYDIDRLEAVDFIYPVNKFRITLIIKKPHSIEMVWSSFIMPFDEKVWIFLFLLLVGCAIALLLMDNIWIRNSDNNSTTRSLEALWIILGVFCSQTQDGSSHVYNRISLLTLNITAIPIITCYTAFLISYITIKRYELPFHDLQELLNDGTYTFGMPNDVSFFSLFKDTNEPLMKKIYHKYLTVEKNLPKTLEEGKLWTCNKKKFTTLLPDFVATMRKNMAECDIQNIPTPITTYVTSFIIQKNSPYKGILRNKMGQMRSSGILQAAWQRNIRKKEEETEEEFTSVTLEQVTVIFVILAVGILLALLVLLAEFVLYYQFKLFRPKKPKCFIFMNK